jgi:hypothetical protein
MKLLLYNWYSASIANYQVMWHSYSGIEVTSGVLFLSCDHDLLSCGHDLLYCVHELSTCSLKILSYGVATTYNHTKLSPQDLQDK